MYQKGQQKTLNCELHVFGQIHCTSLILTPLLKGKVFIYSCERPFFSTYDAEVKKNHIIQNKDPTSYCLSKFDTPVVQNNRLSCCLFLEHFCSTICQQIHLRVQIIRTLNYSSKFNAFWKTYCRSSS